MTFGFIGNAGTVDGTVPTATGAALLAKVRGSNEVVASFFGDGAAKREGPMIGGISAELAALIQKIHSRISRSGRAYCRAADPAAAQPTLVDAMTPEVDQLVDAVMRLAEGARRSQEIKELLRALQSALRYRRQINLRDALVRENGHEVRN